MCRNGTVVVFEDSRNAVCCEDGDSVSILIANASSMIDNDHLLYGLHEKWSLLRRNKELNFLLDEPSDIINKLLVLQRTRLRGANEQARVSVSGQIDLRRSLHLSWHKWTRAYDSELLS